ncbi:MAG: hypothetical protein KJ956_00365 [Actinobacteria bacterium]|nr:hypothetical protein [Actinomycetota bacterium]
MKRRVVIVAVGLTLVAGACGEPADGAGSATVSTTSTSPVAAPTSSVATTTSLVDATLSSVATTLPAVATTVVIGGSDFVVIPNESGGVPPDLEVGCPGGPTFPVSALSSIEPLVGSGREPIEAAIAGFLGSEEGAAWPQADEWQVLYETGEEVILVFIDPSHQTIGFQTVALIDGEWRLSGAQFGGACPLEGRLPAGLNRVTWRVDPEFELDPASTTIHLLAMELECASGQAMGDRLRSPQVVITTDEARITLAADPPPGDIQECPSNPEQSVVIELGMPLGDREIVDGLVVLGDLADFIG